MRAEMSSGEYPEELVQLLVDVLPVDPSDGATVIGYDPDHDGTPLWGAPEPLARAVLDALSSAGRLVPEGAKICDEYGTHDGVREHRRVITTPWTPAKSAQPTGVAAQEQDRTEEQRP